MTDLAAPSDQGVTRLDRTADPRIWRDAKVYTRAGEGPGDSPFADVPEKKRQAMLDDLSRQKKTFVEQRDEQSAVIAAIRHGVKSERDTQPVQVRMLKIGRAHV